MQIPQIQNQNPNQMAHLRREDPNGEPAPPGAGDSAPESTAAPMEPPKPQGISVIGAENPGTQPPGLMVDLSRPPPGLPPTNVPPPGFGMAGILPPGMPPLNMPPPGVAIAGKNLKKHRSKY